MMGIMRLLRAGAIVGRRRTIWCVRSALFIVSVISLHTLALDACASWTNILEPFGANKGIDKARVQWGDIDNDGDLDLAISGVDESVNRRLIFYRNNGNNTFTNVNEPMGTTSGITSGAIDWGDYDNDGDIDLAITGRSGTGADARFVIFRNNGDNTFTNVAEPMGANKGVSAEHQSIRWGDYDNDGDLDLAVCGAFDEVADGVTTLEANKRLTIFRNDGNNSFVNAIEPMGTNTGLKGSSIAWGDYNNDGWLDLAVTGHDGTNFRFIVFKNLTGDTFVNAVEPLGPNKGLTISAVNWGDYDNDGDLDLAVAGLDDESNDRLIVYKNGGNDTFTMTAQPMGIIQGLNNAVVDWGDYDNDGDLDLVVSGAESNYRLIVYRNNGSSSFSNVAEPLGTNVGIQFGSHNLGDFDNDGDLDLVVAGRQATSTYRFVFFRSDTNGLTNLRPDTPTLQSPKGDTYQSGDTITFRWSGVSTDSTPLLAMTYNLRVGSKSGGVEIVSADSNSAHLVNNSIFGNVQSGTTAILIKNLAPGTYYWSVQAVDGGMMRSEWAKEETFVIGGGAGGSTSQETATISVTTGANNPSVQSAGKSQSDLSVLQFRLASDSGVVLSALTVTGTGTGNDASDISLVKLHLDLDGNGTGDQLLGTGTYSTDEGTIQFSGLSTTLPSSSAVTFVVTYTFAGTASNNETFRSRLINNFFSVTNSPNLVITGAPIEGSFVSISDTPTPTTITVAKGSNSPQAQTVSVSQSEFTVLQFTITSDSTVALTSLTANSLGTGNDATDISSVKLYTDTNGDGTGDSLLGSGTYGSDNGTIKFTNLSTTLTMNTAVTYVLTYTLSGTASNNTTFNLALPPTFISVAGASDTTLNGVPLSGETITATVTSNSTPARPTLVSPSNGSIGVSTTTTFNLSGYADADGDTHKCTHWQVSDSTALFSNSTMRLNVVIKAETAGTQFRLPRGLLKGGDKYYWRARFCDYKDKWSAWSDSFQFTTATDPLEITPTTLKAETNPYAVDSRPLGFRLKGGGNAKITLLGAVSYDDEVSDTGKKARPSSDFAFGLYSFVVENLTVGGTVAMTFDVPESVPTTAKYLIYDAASGWIDMTSKLISHDGDTDISLEMTDGGVGDLDGVANGSVVDPGGFVMSSSLSSSSAADGTSIKHPSVCVVARFGANDRSLGTLRTLRDCLLNVAVGRKLIAAYYAIH